MSKTFIGVIVVAAIGLGWLLFSNTGAFDYVVTVDKDITILETELENIEVAVAAGTLTPEQATVAKVKILNQLEKINTSIAESGKAKLTPSQQAQLNEGLNRLKLILITYQKTLTKVDETAVESDVSAQLKSGGRSKNISTAVIETINAVEDNVEEVVENFITTEELDEQIEGIINGDEPVLDAADGGPVIESEEVIEEITTSDGEVTSETMVDGEVSETETSTTSTGAEVVEEEVIE